MFFTILIVIIAIIGVLMTLAVLLQAGQGGGLAGIASGSATQILGNRQAPDVLEKATWTLATAFIVLCILTNFAIDTSGTAGQSVIQDQATGAPTEQALPAAPPADAGTEAPPPDGNQN
jgi:preprotein translocase subunit SecG